MLKILITGVNGFVGKNLYNALKNRFSVTGLDIHKNALFDKMLICDITKPEEIFYCLHDQYFDYVIHCAAIAHNDEGIFKPIDYIKINTQGTINLLNFFKNTPPKRFIFLSTVSVYGEYNYQNVIDEFHPTNPITIYAESKLNAENYLRNQKEINWIILRMPVIYSEDFLKDIQKRTPLKKMFGITFIFKPGNGKQKYSFCHIANLINGILSIINKENPKINNEIIHIADAIFYNTNDLIQYHKRKYKFLVIIRIPKILVFTATYLLGIIKNEKKIHYSNYWKLCKNNQYSINKALSLGFELNKTFF